MIEVSIVTGTYNRLQSLQTLVDSIRFSVGIGIPYEIIIVDGGSTDGTIQWCKDQPDVKLIEHGKLLGAVKAFNDGAYAAQGKYVILANDDIIFINEAIMAAVAFMHDNPYVGIGCFYQDRGGLGWHVATMSASKNGKKTSVYYGQVCIVPKELGDLVGWWGDYLRTYGGDNELSCNVVEAGYKILPIPEACIHDGIVDDELRNKNNVLVKGKHPDTEAWLKKWTRPGSVLGPIIPDAPTISIREDRPLRILYAPIYEPGNMLQRTTKHGLRDALQKIGLVVECDYVQRSVGYVQDVACAFKPDLFVIQSQSTGTNPADFNSNILFSLKSHYPNAFLFCWNGDYHPENLYSQSYIDMLKYFNLVGVVTTEVADRYNQAGVHWMYWQIGYEQADPTGISIPKHDVVFIGNGYSDARKDMVRKVQEHVEDFGLYGIWPEEFHALGNTLYDFDHGAAVYRNAKIAISDSQWPDARGFVSNRLFQTMAAGGALLMQQWFEGLHELLGLEDGVHLVTWKTVDDLLENIDYYLKNEKERQAIADFGTQYMLKYHSFDVRVKELLSVIYK
jgi:glycosyltransferase involved in cell wall biosynthesis